MQRSGCLPVLQVEIGRIELARLFQPLPIQTRQGATCPRDQTAAPQFLKDAIDVHGGQSERIANLSLGGWQLDGVSLCQTDGPVAHQQLVEQVASWSA
jgi:hypothetical protein